MLGRAIVVFEEATDNVRESILACFLISMLHMKLPCCNSMWKDPCMDLCFYVDGQLC